MSGSLIEQLRALLNRYIQPCDEDCNHSQCPLLRELHALHVSHTLEQARLTVKPIVDRERKGEFVGDLMNMRLQAERVIEIVAATRQSPLWNREGYDAALSATLGKLRTVTPPTIPSDATMRAAEGVKRFSHTYEDGIWCMDERPDGKWVRYSDIAAIITRHLPQSPAAGLGDLFALFERDKAGRWNFKSLSRDEGRFDSIMDRLAAATTSPETPVGGDAKIDFSCRVCGVQCDVAPDPPARAVCPEHCEDHDYEYQRSEQGTYCNHCGQQAPEDWYDN